MPPLTYLLHWPLCFQSIAFPTSRPFRPSCVPSAEQALPVLLEMKVRDWGCGVCAFTLQNVSTVCPIIIAKKVTGKPRLGLHLREGLGFMVVVAKQTGLIYVLREYPSWRRDWKAFILHPCSTWVGGSYWVSVTFLVSYQFLFLWRLFYRTFLWNLEVSVAAAVLGSWL